MIKALLAIRFRGLFAGATTQRAKNQRKKRSIGTVVLFVVLYLYVIAVVAGMMCVAFSSLSVTYHALGLDWLYFAMAGLMGLGFAVLGSVFTTQNQLYDAKDNELLLAMPIPPKAILLSRIVPLLALNFLFAGMVMIPATVMYAIKVEFSIATVLLPLAGLLGICFLAQAIACLLGWLLHLSLSKMNKSFASMLYMVVFLVLYFWGYSKAGEILQAIATNGEKIAEVIQIWIWPLYAMGAGCVSKLWYMPVFLLICGTCFSIVYYILSVTFLHTATVSHHSRKRGKLNTVQSQVRSPISAITAKELHKFLGSPVYLTNMGVGILMTAAIPIAGLFLRDDLMPIFQIPELEKLKPLIICALLAFTVSTCCIATPSVSLEGKNLWILKSMPISARQILLSKLRFHILMTVPVACVAGLVLAVTYGCSIGDMLLCTLIPGLLALLCGLVGMWSGLLWARLDYINEAYPVKQSTAMLVSMFGMMGVPVVLGIGYYLLHKHISPSLFLLLSAAVLAVGCCGLYRVLITWGVKKWESL